MQIKSIIKQSFYTFILLLLIQNNSKIFASPEKEWLILHKEITKLYKSKEKKEIKKGISLINKYLQKTEFVYSKSHPHYASALNNSAALYIETKKYKKAEKLLLLAVEIKKNVWGSKSRRLKNLYSNLAAFYQFRRKFSDSEKYWEMATNLKHSKKENNFYSLSKLGDLYFIQGKFLEAEKIYLTLIQKQEKKLGYKSYEIIKSIVSLSQIYIYSGNTNAIPFLQSYIKKIKNPLHKIVLKNQKLAAYLMYENTKKAAALAKSIQTNLKENSTKLDTKDLAMINETLGNYFIQSGEIKTSEKFLLNSLTMYKNIYKKSNPKMFFIYNSLANFYYINSDKKQASKYSFKAKILIQKIFSVNHPLIPVIYLTLAKIHYLKKDLNSAYNYLKKAKEIYKKIKLNNKLMKLKLSVEMSWLLKERKHKNAKKVFAETLELIKVSPYSKGHYLVRFYLSLAELVSKDNKQSLQYIEKAKACLQEACLSNSKTEIEFLKKIKLLQNKLLKNKNKKIKK